MCLSHRQVKLDFYLSELIFYLSWTIWHGFWHTLHSMYNNSFKHLDDLFINASVNSSCAQAKPPPPRPPTHRPCTLLQGICPPCQCRGWCLFKFCAARGPGICQPRGFFKAFVTCYQNITTQRILLEKQAYWLIWQGQEKLKRVVKACSRFYACISSLLIKPELHSKIGAMDVNQHFWGIESNFCW